MLRWIDTHNHLFVFTPEAAEQEIQAARAVGLVSSLVCAGGPENFEAAKSCAYRLNQAYAVGIHPLFIRERWKEDLEELSDWLERNNEDPRLVAMGECGLDFSEACSTPKEIQEEVLSFQLKLARRLDLPLSLHGRGAMDILFKHLRRLAPQKGVVHAFNGSLDQAQAFLRLGFKLGYGGAMTYEGSKRIRKIFSALPAEAWVLETDCPDMPPAWKREQGSEHPVSTPSDIARYGEVAGELRGVAVQQISDQGILNTLAAFPKFNNLISQDRDC